MQRLLINVLLVGGLILGLVGCEKIGEPWDNTGYFEEERTIRSAEQEKHLRDRVMHTQADR